MHGTQDAPVGLYGRAIRMGYNFLLCISIVELPSFLSTTFIRGGYLRNESVTLSLYVGRKLNNCEIV